MLGGGGDGVSGIDGQVLVLGKKQQGVLEVRRQLNPISGNILLSDLERVMLNSFYSGGNLCSSVAWEVKLNQLNKQTEAWKTLFLLPSSSYSTMTPLHLTSSPLLYIQEMFAISNSNIGVGREREVTIAHPAV